MVSRNILLLLLLVTCALADDHTHEYDANEEVTVWLNKIGPYHNPQETYAYYSLPFCQPAVEKDIKIKDDSLGVILEGDELTDSGLHVKFRENKKITKICDMKLDDDMTSKFTDAVKQHYWYQLYIDELPLWGMLGEHMVADSDAAQQQQNEQAFLYSHKHFSISYNNNQIIEVNLTSENPRPLTSGSVIELTYSVSWTPTEKGFASRFDRYLDFDFFEHQIHWFSLFNSFMMVVFLCGLVGLILMRTIKNDYARYHSLEEDEELSLERVVDESGWKQVHGDVFRPPYYLMLYSALLGTGFQLLCMCLALILLSLVSTLYDERGMLTSALIFFYSLTSAIAGYTSAQYYKRNNGTNWKQCMVLTGALYPAVCLSLVMFLNVVAFFYQSTAQVGFTTLLSIVMIWLFISCPLVLCGTVFGRSTAVANDFPCRVNNLRRPIPTDTKWYAQPVCLALCSGVLPFGSIFIEMYFVFTSFWNYKFYYVYGFMLLVFVILVIVTICVTIVATYVLLNSEDYRWQWTSFFAAGSTALYVFLYSIYYFSSKTRMSGLLQTSFYFGYMGAVSLALFILCGTIGYIGANAFVRSIYSYIKAD